MLQKLFLTAGLLLLSWAGLAAAEGKPAAATKELVLADLLALPTADNYRVDAYLRAAERLQAMGKEKAAKLLRQLAAKDNKYPFTRTLVLCRMLFKPRPKSSFRRAKVGEASFVGRTEDKDWPSEPVEVVQGVPFLVATGYSLGGLPEPPVAYVRYCEKACDWNTERFKPRSKKEKRKALETLLSLPKLKGKLDKEDRGVLEEQLK
jgi:hypothetical protein